MTLGLRSSPATASSSKGPRRSSTIIVDLEKLPVSDFIQTSSAIGPSVNKYYRRPVLVP